MDISLFKKLLQQQLISPSEFENIERKQLGPVSVYPDLTTLLYLGILLLTGALGTLVYQNLDSIGHTVILIVVATLCAACFAYCFKNSKGYTHQKVESPNLLFDYVLLLGCLLMLTFVGYLQFAYNTFGTNWGLATFIPMVLLFITAYYFDHLGVLTMAITNLAAWAGFTVAPLQVISDNDFSDEPLIFTALVVGSGLLAISFVSTQRQIKAHFAFTYKNFGAHILFISLLTALFTFSAIYLVWFIILAIVTIVFFKNAVKEGSFYFFVITLLYAFIGLSYTFCRLMWSIGDGEGALFLTLIYFIATGFGFIKMLIHYNKIFKKDASL